MFNVVLYSLLALLFGVLSDMTSKFIIGGRSTYPPFVLTIFSFIMVLTFGTSLIISTRTYHLNLIICVYLILIGLCRYVLSHSFYACLHTHPTHTINAMQGGIISVLTIIIGCIIGSTKYNIDIFAGVILLLSGVFVYIKLVIKVEDLKDIRNILISSISTVIRAVLIGFVLTNYNVSIAFILTYEFALCFLLSVHDTLKDGRLESYLDRSNYTLILFLMPLISAGSNYYYAKAVHLDVGIASTIISSKMIVLAIIFNKLSKQIVPRREYASMIFILLGIIVLI